MSAHLGAVGGPGGGLFECRASPTLERRGATADPRGGLCAGGVRIAGGATTRRFHGADLHIAPQVMRGDREQDSPEVGGAPGFAQAMIADDGDGGLGALAPTMIIDLARGRAWRCWFSRASSARQTLRETGPDQPGKAQHHREQPHDLNAIGRAGEAHAELRLLPRRRLEAHCKGAAAACRPHCAHRIAHRAVAAFV